MLLIEPLEQRIAPATFTVVNTDDSGNGSLRDAIILANRAEGLDAIEFKIPGAGVQTIELVSQLPAFTDPAFVDGYTQPGSSVNGVAAGNDAVLRIELSGLRNAVPNGLELIAGGSTVRGLLINGFAQDGIVINGPGGDVISGNWIGVDRNGSVAVANGDDGIQVNAPGVTIGGAAPGDRNLISGNVGSGIEGANSRITIQGNFIGTDAGGSKALGNRNAGIELLGAADVTIGGEVPGEGNVISGNLGPGIRAAGSARLLLSGLVIEGNLIGTDVTGKSVVRNASAGVELEFVSGASIGGTTRGAANIIGGNGGGGIDIHGPQSVDTVIEGNFIGVDATAAIPLPNAFGVQTFSGPAGGRIGGTALGSGNTIAFNTSVGIRLDGNASAFQILGNSIYSNGGLGIDLSNDGVSLNDPGDADTGANGLQNFPVLTNAVTGSTSSTIEGTLNSAPSSTFRIEFFVSPAPDPSGYGEGRNFIGATGVTTDANGFAAFGFPPLGGLAPGTFVTATATDARTNNTSEFSQAFPTRLTGAPDLLVTVTDGLTTTTTGALLRYTLNYSNEGTREATGVRLTQVVPEGTTFNAGASTAGWTATGTPGVFALGLGTVAGGGASGSAMFAVTVQTTVPAGLDQIVTFASIADDGSNGADPKPDNNNAADTTNLDAAPDLELVINDNPALARKGGTIRYDLTFSNEGNQDASGTFLTQQLPANTTFNVSASAPGWTETAPGSRTYQLSVGDVSASPVKRTAIFAVDVASIIPREVLELSSNASIADDGFNGTDATPANNSAGEVTPVYHGIFVIAPGIPHRLNKGAPPTVRVFNSATGLEAYTFDAYEPEYRDSIRLAVGDLNGDGVDDIITSARLGTGRVRVFDGLNGQQFTGPLAELDPFEGRSASSKGAFVALGDVTGDGLADIVVGSAKGGGALKVFNGTNGAEVSSSFPFGKSFKGGVRVAVGDVNGDGVGDVIVGQGDNGARVKVFSGAGSTVLHDFNAGPKKYRSGVFVAAADFDSDGLADIIAGRNAKRPPLIEVFSGIDRHVISSFAAFDPDYKGGVRVAATDVNFDGIADIIATTGTKGESQVKAFHGRTNEEIFSFAAFPEFPDVALFAAGTTVVSPDDQL